MNNNRQFIHKKHMFDILKAVYQSKFGKYLWFKWWTALYFFYDLPRFSVDLDFDLIQSMTWDQTIAYRDALLWYLQSKFPDFKFVISGTLSHSFRFVIKYWWLKTIKFEVNSKIYDNNYNFKKLFWLEVQVMDLSFSFSHKLCAFISRYKSKGIVANRDLFDIDFFLNKWILPDEKIIEIRTVKLLWEKMWSVKYLQYLHDFLTIHYQNINKNILNWLWELIDTKQKNYITKNFLDDLLGKIKFYIKESK